MLKNDDENVLIYLVYTGTKNVFTFTSYLWPLNKKQLLQKILHSTGCYRCTSILPFNETMKDKALFWEIVHFVEHEHWGQGERWNEGFAPAPSKQHNPNWKLRIVTAPLAIIMIQSCYRIQSPWKQGRVPSYKCVHPPEYAEYYIQWIGNCTTLDVLHCSIPQHNSCSK